MSNHYSYTPSLLFVVWSTDHVAQHSEAISRKVCGEITFAKTMILIARENQIRKAASHLADVSVHGEPAVAVLVDDTVETVFQDALASLDLDLEGRPLVEQSSITGTPDSLRCASPFLDFFSDSLSKQIAMWHKMLAHVLGRIPTFDDEGECSD